MVARKLLSTLTAGLALFLLFTQRAPAQNPPAPVNEDAADTLKSSIVVSKETTVVVEPLDEQGFVNVVEAVNRKISQGVTPQNNAMVPLLKAVGPSDIGEDIRDAFFDRLGIDVLPAEGDYLIDSGTFGRQQGIEDDALDAYFDRVGEAQQRPWRKADYPHVAAWLAANKKPLEQIVVASQRARYYVPLVAPEGESPTLLAILLPTLGPTREAARLLTTRAMLHIGQQQYDAAADDLLACHRLGRLCGQGPTLVDALVGIAIDGMATQGDLALAAQPKLSSKQAKTYADQLADLPPLPKMVDKIDFAERLMYVDAVIMMARTQNVQLLAELGNAPQLLKLIGQPVDWNETLKVGHQWYDKLVAAMRNPDDQERAGEFESFQKELQESAELMRNPLVLAAIPLMDAKTRRTYLGKQLGQVLSALLLPAMHAAQRAEYRGQALSDLSRVALALSAYRTDHGRYPAELAALRDTYLKTIPLDPFSGKPLIYRGKEDGYLLYSLGPNRQDDGGADHQRAWDEGRQDFDLVVRMPLEETENATQP